MKIALIHDYLREYGGAERVIEALHDIWPEAPLFTAFVDGKSLGRHTQRFKHWDIRTSWAQGNPFIKKFISPLRFLAPNIWESFDLSPYDVVISSSGWFMCRGVNAGSRISQISQGLALKTRPQGEALKRSLHICYIHHPPRNLYGYATGSDLQKYWPVRAYAAVINFFLRHYDFETAQRVDYFIANSKETARRVAKFYRRDSTVIYPPIEIPEEISKGDALRTQGVPLLKREYFLSVGRLTYAKRIDLAIIASNKLKLPLKIVGVGKEEAYLRSIAGPTIEFLGSVSDSELAQLYAGAKALIFCALDEDFGMVPVEAMAYGTPVIALAQGGVLETVVDARSASSGQGPTGVFFDKPEVRELVAAIKRFNNDYKIYKDYHCYNQAKKFSKERFKKQVAAFVDESFKKHVQ
ncbi:glycosyltransferase [Candidatus Gottesmanbacteria bacterium]|nr:glycosyltransferase [Candidatus Gottesmanbacteria bacterium]